MPINPASNSIARLFFFKDAAPTTQQQAIATARKNKLVVATIHPGLGIQVLANTDEALVLMASNLFQLHLSTKTTLDVLATLNEKQKVLANSWNTRFTGNKKNSSFNQKIPYIITDETVHRAIEPNTPQFNNPASNVTAASSLKAPSVNSTSVSADQSPPVTGTDQTPTLTDPVNWKMTGTVSVRVIFVESEKESKAQFQDSTRLQLEGKLHEATTALSEQHPAKNLSWIFHETEFVKLDIAADREDITDGEDKQAYDNYWRYPAVKKLVPPGTILYNENPGIQGSQYKTAANQYRLKMQVEDASDYAILIFISAYKSSWGGSAYPNDLSAFPKTIRMAKHVSKEENWCGNPFNDLHWVFAHEICHLFGPLDEYKKDDVTTDSCNKLIGVDKIPNANVSGCSLPRRSCLMRSQNVYKLCNYSKGHLGWSHLFIETFTADEAKAGTTDDVWLDIGDKQYKLENDGDDREPGYRDGYAIWDESLKGEDIKRILLRKAKDGKDGGWKLERVVVYFKGKIIFDGSPQCWLSESSTWLVAAIAVKNVTAQGTVQATNTIPLTNSSSILKLTPAADDVLIDASLINSIKVQITTGTQHNAGTNDKVYFSMAGETWELDNKQNNFEKGAFDEFMLEPRCGLHFRFVESFTISKSKDGAYGGWQIAQVKVWLNNTLVWDSNVVDNMWLSKDTGYDWIHTITLADPSGSPSTIPANANTDAVKAIIVNITTGNLNKAGTDDQVRIIIGHQQFFLNSTNGDSFEKGKADNFSLLVPSVTPMHLYDITGFKIVKAHDGNFGAWYLQGIEVFVECADSSNNQMIYANAEINTWLSNSTGLEWTSPPIFIAAPVAPPQGPPPVVVPPKPVTYVGSITAIIKTGDVSKAGTDDNVYLAIGGKRYLLDNKENNFERGKTDTFTFDGGGLSYNAIKNIRIEKDKDGASGGWFLQAVTIKCDGRIIFSQDGINWWLKDESVLFWQSGAIGPF